MKIGTTSIVLVKLEVDVTKVSKIIWTLKSANTTITKNYPNDVTYADGYFGLPLTQENTTALGEGIVRVEGQVNYSDKAVAKTETISFRILPTLATEVVTGNAPTGGIEPEELKVKISGDVIIAQATGGGSGTWGSISGTLSDQTDLKAALDSKANTNQIPSLNGYATESYVTNAISDKADRSEIPSLTGYATQNWVQNQGYTTSEIDDNTTGVTNTWSASKINQNLSDLEDVLKGKKLYINGDSIAYGAGYVGGYGKCISDAYKMTVVNDAISGATFAENVSGRSSITTTLINSTNYQNADYILLEGGVNDAWNGEASLGTITSGYSDSFDTSTTLGGLEKCLYILRRNCSDKKIGFVFPHGGMLSDSHAWNTTFKPEMKKALFKWGVPYIDIELCSPRVGNYGISGLKTVYTTDGTHPNKKGYDAFYLNQIAEWMKGSYPLSEVATENETPTTLSYDSETIWKYYQPNANFSKNILMDWNNGDYIEAKIDITSCTRNDGEDIFSFGLSDIATWNGGYKFHMYYVKNTSSILVQCISNTNHADKSVSVSGQIKIKVTNAGIYINNILVVDFSAGFPNEMITNFKTSNEFEIGSMNDGAISHAKYIYCRVCQAL